MVAVEVVEVHPDGPNEQKNKPDEDNNPPWLTYFWRIGLNSMTHPFEYAKVLIQVLMSRS